MYTPRHTQYTHTPTPIYTHLNSFLILLCCHNVAILRIKDSFPYMLLAAPCLQLAFSWFSIWTVAKQAVKIRIASINILLQKTASKTIRHSLVLTWLTTLYLIQTTECSSVLCYKGSFHPNNRDQSWNLNTTNPHTSTSPLFFCPFPTTLITLISKVMHQCYKIETQTTKKSLAPDFGIPY